MHETSTPTRSLDITKERKSFGNDVNLLPGSTDSHYATNITANIQYNINDLKVLIPGIKRIRDDSDSDLTISASGYESDSEEEKEHKQDRKRRKIQINDEVIQRRERCVQSRAKIFNTVDCCQYSTCKSSSSYMSALNELSTYTSSVIHSSSGSDTSSSSTSDSSGDSVSSDSSRSMESSSDSGSDSLGLSLSDTSSSSSSSDDDDILNADDTGDEVPSHKYLLPKSIRCSKSCVCNIGCSSPLRPIVRRGGVATPIYKRLLTSRLLSAENVSKFDCCEDSCYVYWLH